MKCPKCGGEKQKVLQSRPFGEETWRQRKCLACNFIFVTYEAVAKEHSEGKSSN
jgi:transcriptional regulator NrdR family protein